MGVSFMVRSRTEQECQQALDDVCRLLGARVTMLPTDRLGDRWIARAERTEAPDHEVRGLAVR